ncbi:hypothetical protein ABZ920_01925 [Streptomyces sp. NPDC046831]|uniref:hypothetical protein n=1 Tax=Streptomyces sp. NPDC046831 TaxID=3154805 RepID=UPI0033D4C415
MPDPPAVGVQLTVPAPYEWLQWFGHRRHENHQDRKTSASVGRWRSTDPRPAPGRPAACRTRPPAVPGRGM